MASATDLPVSHIFVRADARKLDDAAVRALMGSISEIGIVNALRVRPAQRHVNGALADAYEVTAGAHRLTAARKLGFETVPCFVVDDDDITAELAMIDENLCRAELSPADRAQYTARRKAIYEERHPETKHGAIGGGHGKDQSRQLGDSAPDASIVRFTADTAVKTGKSERAVQRDAARGEAIDGSVLARVRGTALDTGEYLDRLKKVDKADQSAKVDADLRRAAAEKRKPVAPADPPRNEFELINAEHRALVKAWENARPEARERFLSDIGATLDTPPIMDRRFGS